MAPEPEWACEWDSLPNPLFNFWTIGNVSEVAPGVALPLMATMFQPVDYLSTKVVAERIESLDLVPSFEPPVGNFLACYAGRMALNLGWANALIQTWTVGDGSGLMAQYVTSTDGKDISAQASADVERAKRTFERVLRWWADMLREVPEDRQRVAKMKVRAGSLDLPSMSEDEIIAYIHELLDVGTDIFSHHLFVGGAAGEYTSWLSKFLDRTLPGHDPALPVVLTSALRDVESAKPSMGAWDVARFIASRPALAAEFRTLHTDEIARRAAEPPSDDWREFGERFRAFLAEYGFRGQREVDPMAADWEEEPAFALSAIKAYVDSPEERSPYHLEEEAAQRREAVERQVEQSLPEEERAEYRRLLEGAQTYTRLRESSKANWVRSTRLIRRPLLELGRRLAARGILQQADDLAFLTWEEVQRAARNGLSAAEAQEHVARRSAQHQKLQEFELPEVFELPVQPARKTGPQQPANNTLTGMPVSAGKATGRARVVLSAEAAQEVELEPGEILVAPYTDAPWTPLFIPAVGVVVETGGLLSHAATVAREFGIPAVVAVKGAAQIIETGREITVDGNTGQVILH